LALGSRHRSISDYINGDIRLVDGIRKTVTTRLQV
jgi:hypothetical protein